jgi:hypothetical protein
LSSCRTPSSRLTLNGENGKITGYRHNAFLSEEGSRKIAIDPGALFLY